MALYTDSTEIAVPATHNDRDLATRPQVPQILIVVTNSTTKICIIKGVTRAKGSLLPGLISIGHLFQIKEILFIMHSVVISNANATT